MRLGGWRTDLGKVDNTLICGEDEDIFRRLMAGGLYYGYYDPQVVVHHYVPPERLTRRYFRRWFFWLGKTYALMCQDLFPTIDMATVPRIFGVPRFLYRQALEQAGRWLAAVPQRDRLQLEIEELRTLQFAGLFVESWRQHRRTRALLPERRADAWPGSGSRLLDAVSPSCWVSSPSSAGISRSVKAPRRFRSGGSRPDTAAGQSSPRSPGGALGRDWLPPPDQCR